MERTHLGRITFWTTAGFVLLQLGWLLVMPPFTGIDEFDHAKRAISVSAGHWYAKPDVPPSDFGRGDLIPTREDIVTAASPACARLPYTRPFDCRPARDLPGDEVVSTSAASRYNPSFYALVGFPAKPFHGNAALYVMRIVAILACAALFALSVRMTLAWAGTRWPLVAVMLAALPTTVYSTTLAAPNGLEMMAGLTLWCALLSLAKTGGRPLWGYATFGLSAAVLVNMHTLGALWLALVVAAGAVLLGARVLARTLWPRSRAQWLVAAVSATLIAFAVVWVKVARANDPTDFPAVIKESVWPQLPREMALWPFQAIGAFPLRDQPAPTLAYAIAIPLLVWFAIEAVRAVRSSRDASMTRAMLAIVVVSFVVPAALTVASYSRLAMTWQGRYGMPFTVGLILLFGVALDRVATALPRAVLAVGLVLWIAVQVVSQLGVLDYQRSDPALIEATGWWAPAWGVVVLLGAAACWAWWRALGSDTATRIDAPAATSEAPARSSTADGDGELVR